MKSVSVAAASDKSTDARFGVTTSLHWLWKGETEALEGVFGVAGVPHVTDGGRSGIDNWVDVRDIEVV